MIGTSSNRFLWVVLLLVVIAAASAWMLRRDDGAAGPNIGAVTSSERPAIDAILAAVPAKFKVDDEGHVVQLVARGPQMTDAVAVHLRQLPYLEDLQLEKSAIGGEGMEAIGRLKSLESLRLEQTGITDEDVRHLEGLAGLRELFLAECPIGDEAMRTIGQISGLLLLDVSHTQVTDEGVRRLQDLTKLEKLYLEGTEVTGSGLTAFPDPHDLTLLNLSEAPLTSEGIDALHRFHNLDALYLDGVRFDDALLARLMDVVTESFPELNGLFLSETPLTDSAVDSLMALAEMPHLSLVGLNATQITKAGFQKLAAKTPETRYLVDYEPGNR